MSHDCPECARLCYCDLEDTYMPEASADCLHTCEPEYDEEAVGVVAEPTEEAGNGAQETA